MNEHLHTSPNLLEQAVILLKKDGSFRAEFEADQILTVVKPILEQMLPPGAMENLPDIKVTSIKSGVIEFQIKFGPIKKLVKIGNVSANRKDGLEIKGDIPWGLISFAAKAIKTLNISESDIELAKARANNLNQIANNFFMQFMGDRGVQLDSFQWCVSERNQLIVSLETKKLVEKQSELKLSESIPPTVSEFKPIELIDLPKSEIPSEKPELAPVQISAPSANSKPEQKLTTVVPPERESVLTDSVLETLKSQLVASQAKAQKLLIAFDATPNDPVAKINLIEAARQLESTAKNIELVLTPEFKNLVLLELQISKAIDAFLNYGYFDRYRYGYPKYNAKRMAKKSEAYKAVYRACYQLEQALDQLRKVHFSTDQIENNRYHQLKKKFRSLKFYRWMGGYSYDRDQLEHFRNMEATLREMSQIIKKQLEPPEPAKVNQTPPWEYGI